MLPRSVHGLDLTPSGEMFPSPADWRDQFIYFLLVDRFDDNLEHPPYNPSMPPRAENAYKTIGSVFQGGNLRGVTRKLDYLKRMGVTAVWLSPVLKNRLDDPYSYHGYGVQDFLAIDPRFGTKEDLKELTKKAHELGIYVILDIIVNHTGNNWAYENDDERLYRHDGKPYTFGFWRAKNAPGFFENDDAVWPAELQSPECYKRRGQIVNWFNQEESENGDFTNFKELDLQSGLVLETLKAVYKYWIVQADLDGYRIDTVKHMEDNVLSAFCSSIKEFAQSVGKKNFFIFGEVVSDDTTLRRYVGPRTMGEEKAHALDACLDFPLYFVLEEVLKGVASPQLLRDRYERLKQLYSTSDASEYFVTFVDNHDQMARPYRRFLHGADDPLRALLAIGYLLTTPGIPSIYYGTEQGFDGAAPPGPFHDSAIRECMFGGTWGAFQSEGMHFFNPYHQLYLGIGVIAEARKRETALRYGRMYFREISEDGHSFSFPALGWGYIAFSRLHDDNEVVVALNVSPHESRFFITVDWALSPPGTLFYNLLEPENTLLAEERVGRSAVALTLPPFGIALLKNHAPAVA